MEEALSQRIAGHLPSQGDTSCSQGGMKVISLTGLDGNDTGRLQFGVIFSRLKIRVTMVVSNPTVCSQLTVNNIKFSEFQSTENWEEISGCWFKNKTMGSTVT